MSFTFVKQRARCNKKRATLTASLIAINSLSEKQLFLVTTICMVFAELKNNTLEENQQVWKR